MRSNAAAFPLILAVSYAVFGANLGIVEGSVPFRLFSTGNGSTQDGHVDPHWTFTNSATSGNALVANNPGTDFNNGTLSNFAPDSGS